MKLLLIHQPFATPKDGGGTRHFEFGARFVQDGNEFEVITSDRSYLTGHKRDPEIFRKYSADHQGLCIVPAFTYRSLHWGKLGRVVSLLSFMISSFLKAIFAKNVDVVMGTSPPIFQAVSAWLVSVIRRRPFILEVRDLWPAFLVEMGVLKNRLLIKVFKWLELFLYNRACHIIVNSPAYEDYLIDQGMARQKITVVPNGVDPSMFNPDGDGAQFRDKHQLGDCFVLTYAGAIGKANDIDTLLEAARILIKDHEDIRILLIGSGMERNRLESVASQYNISNVQFLGSIPKPELAMALAASDACVATLKNIKMFSTTYPNKVFDYMAAGRPTILAIDGVIREVIERANGGIFVTPGTPGQLAAAILELYHDRDQCSAMGRNAREYVVKRFNRDDQAQSFKELVFRLAHQKG